MSLRASLDHGVPGSRLREFLRARAGARAGSLASKLASASSK
ncbi:MAG: hypothetical protein ABSD85_13045 [Acidimicrobiales bacterium]